jgi:micrococcal nuclease
MSCIDVVFVDNGNEDIVVLHLKNRTFWIVVTFLVISAALATRELLDTPPVGELQPSGLPRTAVVSYVYDGDSFETEKGYEVRLLSIDAPEKDAPLADEARQRLRELAGGEQIRLTYEKDKKDRYGRLLCHAYNDGKWINRVIVSEGLAVVYLFKPNLATKSELVTAQKAARQAETGIWSLPPPPPEDYYIYSRGRFRFHRPDCEHARDISPRNRVRLETRDDALDKGLSPCRACKP